MAKRSSTKAGQGKFAAAKPTTSTPAPPSVSAKAPSLSGSAPPSAPSFSSGRPGLTGSTVSPSKPAISKASELAVATPATGPKTNSTVPASAPSKTQAATGGVTPAQSPIHPPLQKPAAAPVSGSAPASNKREVTFSIVAPQAHEVSLVGSFTNWDKSPVGLEKSTDGVWKKTLSLAPGKYEYRLLVDGKWQDDPKCDDKVPNPFGSHNCLRKVA
jgi:hypothetical protein